MNLDSYACPCDHCCLDGIKPLGATTRCLICKKFMRLGRARKYDNEYDLCECATTELLKIEKADKGKGTPHTCRICQKYIREGEAGPYDHQFDLCECPASELLKIEKADKVKKEAKVRRELNKLKSHNRPPNDACVVS